MVARISTALALLCAVALPQEWGDTQRLKVTVAGKPRKIALFVPKGVKKNESLPLLVAIPNQACKSHLEIQNWEQHAYKARFAIFSVDTITGSQNGWHPKEQLEMSRDIEAVEEGLKVALEWAESNGLAIDTNAMAITGHSGGAYLAAWMGVRQPERFMGICLRSPVFFKETLEHGDPPLDKNQRIFLSRGELDDHRVIAQTELAVTAFKKAGYATVVFRIIPKADHKPMKEVGAEWFEGLLKSTAAGRADARKIAIELVKVKEALDKGRAGAYGKLAKLAQRERKAGFDAGAVKLLDGVEAEANKDMKRVDSLVDSGSFDDAIAALKKITRKYNGLEIAKTARKRVGTIKKSDDYKAAGMLADAKKLRDKGKEEQALKLLEKLATKYPKTAAGEEAALLLKS
ncbi:MAG: prolyl oligopeptidase family serine peptidase [Planctomycetota bacterium]|jgi:predicted esterase